MNRIIVVLLIALGLPGCSNESRTPLEVTEVRIFAPLPGSTMSVAYMIFENTSDRPINVTNVSSPQFASVELHETRVVDGVARMRSLDDVVVSAGAILALEENGKHLMLMQPISSMAVRDPVTLRVSYDDNGLLIISAPLRPRIELDDSH